MSNHYVGKTSGNLIHHLIIANWKVIGYSRLVTCNGILIISDISLQSNKLEWSVNNGSSSKVYIIWCIISEKGLILIL